MVNTRNILLIGRTGSGKSSLANVISETDKFIESARSTSVTKNIEEGIVEIDLKEDGSEKIRYRVIDTIGIGDTKITPQGVLTKLAEMGGRVKQEGLNQILFVTKGRFSKEEIETYDLLSSIIFDSEVLKFTTIVRVGFPEFEDQEVCDEDRWQLRAENPKLAHILNSAKVVYLDNPPLKGRNTEANKEIREESRKRLLTYLATCQGNYRPSNIDTLDERVQEYKTDEQKFKIKMKELETARKEQEEKFRKEMTELKAQQEKDLREMREKAENDLRRVEAEGKETLRTTVNDLETKQRQREQEMKLENEKRLEKMEEKHKEEAKSIREDGEKQIQGIQTQMQQDRSKMDDLQNKLQEANNKNAETVDLMIKTNNENREREEKREDARIKAAQEEKKERQAFEQKILDAEKQSRIDANAREEKRLQAEAKKEENRHQEEVKRLQEEKQSREKMEKIEKKKAAWAEWEVRNKQYLQEQDAKMFWNQDGNWRRDGLPKPSSNIDDY